MPQPADQAIEVYDPTREVVADDRLTTLAVSELQGAITLPGDAEITAVGIDIARLPSETTPALAATLTRSFLEELRLAAVKGSSAQFAVGDLAMWARKLCGPEYDDLISSYGYAPHTIDNAVWVCRAVPYDMRLPFPLTFTHHRVVAALWRWRGRQRYWLDRAAQEGMSTRELADLVQKDADKEAGDDPAVADVLRAGQRFASQVTSLGDIGQWRAALLDVLLTFKRGMGSDAWARFRAELHEDLEGV